MNLQCPVPAPERDIISLAHGGGGRAMHALIERVFLPRFGGAGDRHDGTVLEIGGVRVAFACDAHVVSPLRFPGGDIGSLAVFGTVNDVAMCGARPLALSAAFVLEEGFPLAEVERVAESMGAAARAAGVEIVTGDTKVVERGRGDGCYVATSGVGPVVARGRIGPAEVREGDAILLSGDVGRHGIAVLATRQGLGFESSVESDCAPLHGAVLRMIEGGTTVRCLRDLTRGGLASALAEISAQAGLAIEIEEEAVPVLPEVAAACELFGFDPFYVPCEGRFVAFVPGTESERALGLLWADPVAAAACRIGRVTGPGAGAVTLRTRLGARRVLDLLTGEQLPRIC